MSPVRLSPYTICEHYICTAKNEAMTLIKRNLEAIVVLAIIGTVCAVCLALGLHL